MSQGLKHHDQTPAVEEGFAAIGRDTAGVFHVIKVLSDGTVVTSGGGGGSTTVDQGLGGASPWLVDVNDRSARVLGHVTVDTLPAADVTDRSARLLGHVTVDALPSVDVSDRSARLLGHVTVDAAPATVVSGLPDIQSRDGALTSYVVDRDARRVLELILVELQGLRLATQALRDEKPEEN